MSVRERLETGTAQAVRWGLGHALPRAAISGSARRGDLHGRLIMATMSRPDAPVDLFDEVRASGTMHRSRFAFVTASQPMVREVLTSADVKAGVEFGPDGPLSGLARWAWAGLAARPADPAVAARHRAARPHPLPQARHPGLQRQGGRAAARRAPRRSRPA